MLTVQIGLTLDSPGHACQIFEEAGTANNSLSAREGPGSAAIDTLIQFLNGSVFRGQVGARQCRGNPCTDNFDRNFRLKLSLKL
jgi:hypothetical protein